MPKFVGWSKRSSKREVHSDKYHLNTQERCQTNNLTLYLKELEREQETKSKFSRRKEIKIRTEINKIEIKKKRKVGSLKK